MDKGYLDQQQQQQQQQLQLQQTQLQSQSQQQQQGPCLTTMTTKTTTTTTTTTITEHNFLVPELQHLVISPRLESASAAAIQITSAAATSTTPSIYMLENNTPIIKDNTTGSSSGASSSSNNNNNNDDEYNILDKQHQQLIKKMLTAMATTSQQQQTTPSLSPPSPPMIIDECQLELSGVLGRQPLASSPPADTTTPLERALISSSGGANTFELATTAPLTQTSPSSSTPPLSRANSTNAATVPIIRARVQRPIRQKSPASIGERPLLHAVLVQEEIKTLINQEDINARDANGNSILHRVAIIGSMLAIRHIVLRGARVNSVNNSGLTPLHYAACANPQSVEVLLYYGSLPNIKDNNKETPLFFAVDRGQTAIVSLLLSRGAKVTTTNRSMQRSAIHVAAIKGFSNILRLLLDYKCNINEIDVGGSTPLHLTIYNSPTYQSLLSSINYCHSAMNSIDAYMSCCELLLQRGAIITAQDTQGYTPLHIASRQGKKNFIDLLLFYCKQQKNKATQPLSGVNSSSSSKLRKELKSEIVLYIPDNKGRIPLHAAAIGGHSRVLECLVGTGRKCTTVTDDMGMTPLCLASMFGHFDCVEYLYNLVDIYHGHGHAKLTGPSQAGRSLFDNAKSPVDPLGSDFRFALDGDYCDLVFLVEGRDIFAHSVILRQYKLFRDMIRHQKLSGQLPPLYAPTAQSHMNPCAATTGSYYGGQFGGTYGSQYSYNSFDASSYHAFHMASINEYDDEFDYNSGGRVRSDTMGGGGGRTRSRMNSVVNPNCLMRIPVEKGVSYDIFRAVLQFAYTCEIPRETINTSGKLSELLEFANQCDLEVLSNLCIDTMSQHSNGRLGTLEMSKYLLKQINSRQSADVAIVFDGGQVAHAHSVVLANRCTFFKLHFESYPVNSRSSIALFPAGSLTNSVAGGLLSSSLSSSYAGGLGTTSPMRRLSCPSSPALSDIQTASWVIDIGDASYKAVMVMLEYIYGGCIPSANSAFQAGPTSAPSPASDASMDVIDIMLLSKLAYTLNLPVLQQYSSVLLYSILDPSKLVTIIKTIYSFDGNVGWGRTPSLESIWGICLEWLVKRCNWNEMMRYEPFLQLGAKFIKDVKKERKEKKKKQKLTEKHLLGSAKFNNVPSTLPPMPTSSSSSQSQSNIPTVQESPRKKEDKPWLRNPKMFLRTVSAGKLYPNVGNNNGASNSAPSSPSLSPQPSIVMLQSQSSQSSSSQSSQSPPNSPPKSQPDNSPPSNSPPQSPPSNRPPKLQKRNSLSQILQSKKTFFTSLTAANREAGKKSPPNRSKSFAM
ncbi:hypothetical protein SAMD00019534_126280 [Acytostelium subglobosum LB1]|uniref:hypothetical protein n=1 Tax=Acytostelium subglobosum LB1 TaxID=1410327 RepID=UPI000644EE1F|nr:hypothetical protein SAMD00019534_126280 [Acytostelium subglobosum LB1]GAM29452.1 hypothetical protein SAMD00019534_126280 [Acytostelium subglobosum LB1]|eukprot:XP_012747597.1 hypothetical protein SAMD00019534_126280 [Acytostelium subglobosum LB1]